MQHFRPGFIFLFIATVCQFISCSQSAQNVQESEPAPAHEVQAASESELDNQAAAVKEAAKEASNAKLAAVRNAENADVEGAKEESSEAKPAEPADAEVRPAEPADAENEVIEQDNSHRIDSLDPLSEEQVQILSSIEWDVDPEVLNAVEQKNEGGHFPFSDEKHLDLFKEHIENLGGTYIGVGTDQGYLFTGWQRPTLAFVIDYDPWVVMIHKIYMLFWNECEDSACLHHYFDDREAGMNMLKSEKGIAVGLDAKLPLKVYKTTQRSIARQLKRLERMEVKTFMNDAESFTYIKKLIAQGRVRTLQANLLGDKAFASIASAMNKLGAKVTTLYLSNAEQYWGYSSKFKANMIGMPAADNALIIRTSATYPNNNDYRYSIQPVSVFKAWLQHPDGRSVRDVTKRVHVKDPEDFPFVIDDFLPPQAKE